MKNSRLFIIVRTKQCKTQSYAELMLAFLVHSTRPHNKRDRFGIIGSAFFHAAAYDENSTGEIGLQYSYVSTAAQMFSTHTLVFSLCTWPKGVRHLFSTSAQQAEFFQVALRVVYGIYYEHGTWSPVVILGICCDFFTAVGLSFYPTTSAHPVSVPIHPRETPGTNYVITYRPCETKENKNSATQSR